MKRAFLVALVIVVPLFVPGVASAAPPTPLALPAILTSGGTCDSCVYAFKPASIGLSADGNGDLAHMTWPYWGDLQATGYGDKVSYEVPGHTWSYGMMHPRLIPVSVQLSDPVMDAGQLAFARMVVFYNDTNGTMTYTMASAEPWVWHCSLENFSQGAGYQVELSNMSGQPREVESFVVTFWSGGQMSHEGRATTLTFASEIGSHNQQLSGKNVSLLAPYQSTNYRVAVRPGTQWSSQQFSRDACAVKTVNGVQQAYQPW